MKIDADAILCEGPNLVDLIMKARKEAVARGIKADSIVINANMVYVPALFGERPEMVCGLDVHVTKDELPDGYSFAVLHNCNKKTKSPWIPVTERLPEDGEEALCLTKWGRRWVAVWNEMGDHLWTDGEGWLSNSFVTHWTPLPEPPKEDHDE